VRWRPVKCTTFWWNSYISIVCKARRRAKRRIMLISWKVMRLSNRFELQKLVLHGEEGGNTMMLRSSSSNVFTLTWYKCPSISCMRGCVPLGRGCEAGSLNRLCKSAVMYMRLTSCNLRIYWSTMRHLQCLSRRWARGEICLRMTRDRLGHRLSV
jgi:hypothetical protein